MKIEIIKKLLPDLMEYARVNDLQVKVIDPKNVVSDSIVVEIAKIEYDAAYELGLWYGRARMSYLITFF